MASEHFSVQPASLTSLASDFQSSSDQLNGKISEFASRAENVNDAFGVMAASTQTLTNYVEMTRSTVNALQQLREALQNYSAGLQHTVASYQSTDSTQAESFGGK